jgi:phosphohistidine phosphatase
MLTLILLRHAKSDWSDPSHADFDRPLAPRGKAAAPRMGRHMRRIGIRPDHIVCSPARRTRETLALVMPELQLLTADVVYDEAVYEAPATRLLERIQGVSATLRTVMLVGHNPGLQELILHLAQPDASGSYAEIARKFPTTALAVLEFDSTTWAAIRETPGRITHLMTPRRLDDASTDES